MARQQDCPVMLSAAKHLEAPRGRPFAALRVTRDRYHAEERCHAERSEASRCPSREALRCAQGDKQGPSSHSAILDRWLRVMPIGGSLRSLGGGDAACSATSHRFKATHGGRPSRHTLPRFTTLAPTDGEVLQVL